MHSTRKSLLAAVVLSALSIAPAFAEIEVSPLGDGGGTHTYDGLEKYQIYNAPTGATHAGATMRWLYNDASRPANISKASALAGIQAGMAKWSAVCGITFSYQGETSTAFSL